MQKYIFLLSNMSLSYINVSQSGVYISNCKKKGMKKKNITKNNETRNVYCYAHASCKELVYIQTSINKKQQQQRWMTQVLISGNRSFKAHFYDYLKIFVLQWKYKKIKFPVRLGVNQLIPFS